MRKEEIVKMIGLALRPKYLEMMESAITKIQGRNAIYIETTTTYNKCVSELNKLGIGYDARQTKEFKNLLNLKREAYKQLNGEHNPKTNKQDFSNSMIFKGLNKKHSKMIKANSRAEIKSYYTKLYVAELKELVESLYQDIKKVNPENIVKGYSGHDINFTLSLKDGKSKSFTINTIIAGGDIQILHYRVLKKLHKGVI